MGILTFLLLQFVTAPFGKHATPHISKWYGPHLNSRACWMVMEIPNLFQVARVLVNRSSSSSSSSGDGCSLETNFFSIDAWKNPNPYDVLLCLFTVHYVHRAVIYPLIRMRSTQSRPMPLLVCASAFLFCSVNGYLQSESLDMQYNAVIDGRLKTNRLHEHNFKSGIVLFLLGLGINIYSDEILLRIKRTSGGNYQIPKGFLFEYVSCPNMFGEIVEWFGFAIACNSVAAFSFAFYTFCNLAPRAHSHHRWYKKNFQDYPMERKILFLNIW